MIKQRFTTDVYCTVELEGTHNWPNCPFEEVAYLRVPHRHVFHVTAWAPVDHADRDIEFIMLKHKIKEYMANTYYDEEQKLHVFGASSCEMLAKELCLEFNLSACEVNEDKENGAIVTVEEYIEE